MVHPARIVREVRPCGAGTAACGAPAPATDDSAAAPSAAPSTVPPADSSHRAIRQETSATLRRMLEQVVLAGGTGTLAHLDGYTAAGKTGTAQKIDPATGRYSARDYIASFVGFAPVNSPAVTVLVVLDSPEGGHMGGTVAAPVFREVTQQTLSYLRVPPDLPVNAPAQKIPAQRSGTIAADDTSDFNPIQLLDTNAQRIDEPAPALPSALPPAKETPQQTNQTAPAGRVSRASSVTPAPAANPRGSVTVTRTARAATPPGPGDLPPVESTVVLDESNGVPVPSFEGKTVRSFVEECMRLGLSPSPVGAGIAVEQIPAAGTRVRAGSRIVVRFAANAAVHAISQNNH